MDVLSFFKLRITYLLKCDDSLTVTVYLLRFASIFLNIVFLHVSYFYKPTAIFFQLYDICHSFCNHLSIILSFLILLVFKMFKIVCVTTLKLW